MTKKQMKLCKSIRKYENLDLIMKKKGFTHYSQIYDELGTDCFHCSDWNMDENTKLFLEDKAIEELEKRREYLINNWITRIVAIWGGVTGTIGTNCAVSATVPIIAELTLSQNVIGSCLAALLIARITFFMSSRSFLLVVWYLRTFLLYLFLCDRLK